MPLRLPAEVGGAEVIEEPMRPGRRKREHNHQAGQADRDLRAHRDSAQPDLKRQRHVRDDNPCLAPAQGPGLPPPGPKENFDGLRIRGV